MTLLARQGSPTFRSISNPGGAKTLSPRLYRMALQGDRAPPVPAAPSLVLSPETHFPMEEPL